MLLTFALPVTARTAVRSETTAPVALSAWIHIAPDDTVTLFIHKAEMGQGTVTSLSMLLAEELECDWTTIRTEFPGLDPAYGRTQGVYGSSSIRSSWNTLRVAGATARQMLINAAAAQWHIDPGQCHAENSAVINQLSHARLRYGALADAAARLPVPEPPALKDPKDFTVIGQPRKRLDTPSKVNGTATFGIDVRLPGMLYAAVARCPVFGGTVVGVDDSKTKLVAGVKRVVRISSGVAVVADNTWSAMEGRRVLDVTWDEGPTASMSSDRLMKMCADLVTRPGTPAKSVGDVSSALAKAAKVVNAVYQVPFLAHAPMEPLNCTARVDANSCEVWASTQGQTAARQAAMAVTGLREDQVKVNTLYMGGGFGRRTNADYIGEAVEVAKAAGVPIKLTWSRPDDIKHDRFRPASYVVLSGGVDSEGWPVAVQARVACPQFSGPGTAVEGLSTLVYALPNYSVDSHAADAGVPTHFWRSVGYSQNTFFAESFLDQLAALGEKDPLELRRRLLVNQPRLLGVLNLAADKAGWGSPLPAGRARGVAVVNNVGSFNAQVAEVSITGGAVMVHRVVCAVDCGMVVNPAIVRQQIEGGIIFGLSAALKGAITIDRGRVNESSFSDYDVIRMPEAPVIDVHIMASTAAPGGIGEAAVPAIAPAVANALFALTKRRVRQLPIQVTELV